MPRPLYYHSSWLVVAVALIAAPLCAQIAESPVGQSPATAPPERLLVLRNGEVLTGTISTAGERVLVMLPGRQISLRPSEIDVVASTMEEAYALKLNKLRPTDVGGRLDLAAWCIHHRLWTRAQEELTAAGHVQPYNPRLAALGRALQRSMEHDTEVRSSVSGLSSSTATTRASVADREKVAHRIKEPVSQAGFSWPPVADAVDVAAGPPSRTQKLNPERKATESPAALERFVRGLPATAVEQFTTGLHPMITRGCATAGCHAPGNKTEFTLLRLPHGRAPSRRLTQRNLYNTVQLIDFGNPPESRLLEIARQPHGPLKSGVFGDERSPKYQELVAWVTALTGTSAKRDEDLPVDQRTAIVDWERARHTADQIAPSAQPIDLGTIADESQPNQPAEVRTGDR